VSNLVPATLAGETIQTYESNGTAASTISFTDAGTFTRTDQDGEKLSGTYTFTQYSPTVAILQLNDTDASDLGEIAYVEMTFTSTTSGQVFYSNYKNPAYDSYPDDIHLGTFKVQ
jgi:hypothetical protein